MRIGVGAVGLIGSVMFSALACSSSSSTGTTAKDAGSGTSGSGGASSKGSGKGTGTGSGTGVGTGGGSGSSTATKISGSGTGATAVKLGADPNPAVGLAIDSENVYWYDNIVMGTGTTGAGNVLKVPIAGGAVTTLASLTDGCGGFAVSGSNLYWGSNSRALVTMPTSGGTPTTLVAANGITSAYDPRSITANATDVFWCSSTYDIMKTPVGGGTPVTLFKGTGSAEFFDIAVNATSTFWSRGIDVRTVSLSGGTAATAGTSMSPQYVAADSTNVYWVDSTQFTILQAPLGGTTAVTLATRTAPPRGIAIDDQKIYWAEDPNLTGATSGIVMSVPIGGGTVSTIIDSAVLPGDIAVDSTSIYYVEQGIGVSGVWKITPK